MTDTDVSLQAVHLSDILKDFLRLRHRIIAVLPEDLARVKQRLDGRHRDGSLGRVIDYAFYYRIGIVLSQQEKPLIMSELSEGLAVPLSTATRLVDWLVESGYAERLPDPDDRRVVRVALTETGRAFYGIIDEFVRQRIERILRPFSSEERDVLISLLRKLMRTAEEMSEDCC